MPDWQELVRQQLSGLALDAAEKEEVHAELAGHLEEAYEEFLEQGLLEQEAVRLTLSKVQNWQELQQRVQNARVKENVMSRRVSQIWLPGLLTLLLSMGLLMLIELFGPPPFIANRSSWTMVAPLAVIYVPWLVLLPFVGAMGAYLSSRAGASLRLVLVSILFPVLPYFGVFVLAFPVALFHEHVTHSILLASLFVGLIAWVLLPALALLAGGLPTQLYFSRRLSQRGVASH